VGTAESGHHAETRPADAPSRRVVSIVVTYFPDRDIFEQLLSGLLAQTDYVVIADNTPGPVDVKLQHIIDTSDSPVRCRLIRSGENRGIAAAINSGWIEAQDLNADFILLSDQDSQPADDMIAKLIHAYDRQSAIGKRVGAIGPVYTDIHTGLTYPFQAHIPDKFFYGHKMPTEREPIVEALTLITSGTLIPAAVFQLVGPMREDLFIDQVDIEWCHRARSEGYKLFGAGSATMFHRMGEESLRVWYLGWRNESAYSPLRLYYRIRNYIALCKLGYIDWRWKLRSGWYTLGLVYSHVLFGESPLLSLRMSTKGMLHGVLGRMGQLSEHFK
jgi:rhamnosyltransferase